MLPFIKGYSIAADSRTRIHCAAESIGAVPVGGSEDGICNARTWAQALDLRKYKCQLVPKGSEVKMNMHFLALGLGKLET